MTTPIVMASSRLTFINAILHNSVVIWSQEVTRIIFAIAWGATVFVLSSAALWDLKEYLKMVVNIY
jgi:hypothetical protein